MSNLSFTSQGAIITWPNSRKTVLQGAKKCHIFKKDRGYYVLNIRGVVHFTGFEKEKIVIKEPDWFNHKEQHDIHYFPRTNVLVVTFLGGDHDYIWWWNLDKYEQDSKLEKPTWFNGVFNNDLNFERINDRFAFCEEYIDETLADCLSDNTDDEEEEDSDGRKLGDDHYRTLIWDTATLTIYESSSRIDPKKLVIRETETGFEAFVDGKKLDLKDTIFDSGEIIAP